MRKKSAEICLQFNPFPVLKTERLYLRSFLVKDAKDLLEMRTDDRVMKYLGRDKMKDLTEAKAYIQKVNKETQSNKIIEWAITLNHKFIGKLGYWQIMPQHRRAEIGYTLMTEYFGRGLMSEAVAAVLQYGFEEMNLHSIEANVDSRNLKSVQLLTRNGFVKEGHFKENYFYDGLFTDTGSYGLLCSEWTKNKT